MMLFYVIINSDTKLTSGKWRRRTISTIKGVGKVSNCCVIMMVLKFEARTMKRRQKSWNRIGNILLSLFVSLGIFDSKPSAYKSFVLSSLMKNTHVIHLWFTCELHVNWNTCKNPHVKNMWITCESYVIVPIPHVNHICFTCVFFVREVS